MENEPSGETDNERARMLIEQLLAEVSDSWNGSGIRIKLRLLLEALDE